MNILKNLFLLTLVVSATSFSLTGCSDKDDPAPGNDGSAKVQYKLVASEGVDITTIAYYANNSVVTKTGNFGSTWTSDVVTNSEATTIISANGIGPSDQSTLKAQILVDGKVVKENPVSTGKILTTNLSLK